MSEQIKTFEADLNREGLAIVWAAEEFKAKLASAEVTSRMEIILRI